MATSLAEKMAKAAAAAIAAEAARTAAEAAAAAAAAAPVPLPILNQGQIAASGPTVTSGSNVPFGVNASSADEVSSAHNAPDSGGGDELANRYLGFNSSQIALHFTACIHARVKYLQFNKRITLGTRANELSSFYNYLNVNKFGEGLHSFFYQIA